MLRRGTTVQNGGKLQAYSVPFVMMMVVVVVVVVVIREFMTYTFSSDTNL